MIDKPFVVSSSQANELIALAHTHNVLLSVYQNRRWDNDFLTLRHLLETGVLGTISTYEAHYDRYRPIVRDRWRERAEPGSGVLYDQDSIFRFMVTRDVLLSTVLTHNKMHSKQEDFQATPGGEVTTKRGMEN